MFHLQRPQVPKSTADNTQRTRRHLEPTGPIKDQASAGLLALADGYLDAWPTIYPVNTAHSAIPTPLAFQWLVAQQE